MTGEAKPRRRALKWLAVLGGLGLLAAGAIVVSTVWMAIHRPRTAHIELMNLSHETVQILSFRLKGREWVEGPGPRLQPYVVGREVPFKWPAARIGQSREAIAWSLRYVSASSGEAYERTGDLIAAGKYTCETTLWIHSDRIEASECRPGYGMD